MKKFLTAIALVTISTQSYAMFCPNGFNQINIGDTIEQVTQQCGAPTSKETTKSTEDKSPQEWNYYLPANPAQPAGSGTLKMSVAFDSTQKLINITVNGTTVTTTPLCGGSIQIGDDQKTVKKVCGNPAFINKNQEPQKGQAAPVTIETTSFIYDSTPPTTLIFEGGKLTERR